MRSEGYSTRSLCPSVRLRGESREGVRTVRLLATTFSPTTRNKQVKERHQRVQRYTGFIFKMAIFDGKCAAFRVKTKWTSQYAN